MGQRLARTAAVVGACFIMAACGGGGGGGTSGPTPTPVPPSPPTPPPPPGLASLSGPTDFSPAQSVVEIDSSTGTIRVEVADAAAGRLLLTFDPNDGHDANDDTFILDYNHDGIAFTQTFDASQIVTTYTNPLANPEAIMGYGNDRLLGTTLYDAGGGRELETYDITAFGLDEPVEYVRVFRFSETSGQTGLNAFSVFGLQTRASQMPVSGSGQWFGAVVGQYNDTTDALGILDWSANTQLDFDFATGAVRVNFAGHHFSDGESIVGSLNQIFGGELHATLSGSAFQGAASFQLRDGTMVYGDGAGAFFGPGDGAPVEAGGVVQASDGQYFISGAFAATQRPD